MKYAQGLSLGVIYLANKYNLIHVLLNMPVFNKASAASIPTDHLQNHPKPYLRRE